jgi:antitoxin component of MazEF toxin-antitoxin module
MQGAAWATVLGYSISAAWVLYYYISGNSEVKLYLRNFVEISLKNGVLVVEPASKEVDFDELLEKVDKDNIHKLVDFGPPRGKEVW